MAKHRFSFDHNPFKCETYGRFFPQSVPLLYGIERNADYPPFKYIVSFEQSLAAFLLARGPFAWYGYSWIR